MKILIKKIYIIFFLLCVFVFQPEVLARDIQLQYSKKNISNYFSGIISSDFDNYNEAFKYLKKVKLLKDRHYKYNIEFVRTLVLLEKFDQAFNFSKNIWKSEELFFEADLLLGLDYFLKKDYLNAELHFKRLNEISIYNIYFSNFVGNVMMSWNAASQNDEKKSFEYLKKIPKAYRHITKTQNSLLLCYFNKDGTQDSFENLINDDEYNFSRYNFFLTNYLINKNKTKEAKEIIEESKSEYSSNLLIKQTENFLTKNKYEKIKYFYNCQNPEESLAEFFYIIANLYSSEKDYSLSNFYLKISLFLNNKFVPNKALLAENLYYQKQYKISKDVYRSLKDIGPIYSWFASKSIANILADQKGKEYSIKNLEKDFNSITNQNFEHYYDLANFYKDYDYYDESIKYYTIALKNLEKGHYLIPKILDRRGTSFERLNEWEKAEKDLMESLKLLPDQPHVLNYLAYSWIDKGINLDKGLEMLKKATELRKNDGYIIDSLGWAYYAKKNYVEAEFFLRRAVELLPTDPIINDHYADTLWMLDKDIQARYFWKYILNLKNANQELKDSVSKKLIFGINNKL